MVSSWWVLAGGRERPRRTALNAGVLFPSCVGAWLGPSILSLMRTQPPKLVFGRQERVAGLELAPFSFRLSPQVADPHCVILPSLPSSTVGRRQLSPGRPSKTLPS